MLCCHKLLDTVTVSTFRNCVIMLTSTTERTLVEGNLVMLFALLDCDTLVEDSSRRVCNPLSY